LINKILLKNKNNLKGTDNIEDIGVFKYSLGLLWSYGSWIYYYLCNQCQSPL